MELTIGCHEVSPGPPWSTDGTMPLPTCLPAYRPLPDRIHLMSVETHDSHWLYLAQCPLLKRITFATGDQHPASSRLFAPVGLESAASICNSKGVRRVRCLCFDNLEPSAWDHVDLRRQSDPGPRAGFGHALALDIGISCRRCDHAALRFAGRNEAPWAVATPCNSSSIMDYFAGLRIAAFSDEPRRVR